MYRSRRATFVLAAVLFLSSLPIISPDAAGEERKFLVMFAVPPRDAEGWPNVDLPNPFDAYQAYFDRTNPAIDSFHEYWHEISYGRVNVSGDVAGYAELPWIAIWGIDKDNPPEDLEGLTLPYTELTGNSTYDGFEGESFTEAEMMLLVDFDAPDAGAAPVRPPGLADPDHFGNPVWTPGERWGDLAGGTGGVYDYAAAVQVVDPNDPNALVAGFAPEPFEDYLRVYVPGVARDPNQSWVRLDPSFLNPNSAGADVIGSRAWSLAYIQRNYPARELGTLVVPDPNDPNRALAGSGSGFLGRFGNGIYDGPDRWFEVGGTKLQRNNAVPDVAVVSTFDPDAAPAGYVGWDYAIDGNGDGITWWGSYTGMNWLEFILASDAPPAPDPNDPNVLLIPFVPLVDAPVFPTGIPNMVPFDGSQDRQFLPNAGGDLGGARFSDPETPPFEEMTVYPDALGFNYDGPAEYHDLASSIYHSQSDFSGINFGGDLKLGEVKSWKSDSYYGADFGAGDPASPAGPDGLIPPAGPLATRVHGANGFDAGNQLSIEYLTWAKDGQDIDPNQLLDPNGMPLQIVGQPVVYADPNRPGTWQYRDPNGVFLSQPPLFKRDYTLDGLLDQGEVRDDGTENYSVDLNASNSNDGGLGGSEYPFNRRRLVEDTIAALDGSVDWDEFVIYGDEVHAVTILPGGLYPDGLAPGDRGLFQLPAPGMDLYVPVQVKNPNDPTFDPNDATFTVLRFSDFATKIGSTGEVDIPTEGLIGQFLVPLMCHEWLHVWEGYPDLYDYDVYFGGFENTPLLGWEIMAGGFVHPNPLLKDTSGWVRLNNLRDVLIPLVETEVTLTDFAFDPTAAWYFENDFNAGEAFHFWRITTPQQNPRPGAVNFHKYAPAPGMLLMHADAGLNPESTPLQQRIGTHFTWKIVQADGEFELENAEDFGDDGDVWPGSTGATQWSANTLPSSNWYGQLRSGLSITNITELSDHTIVTFRWSPQLVPTFAFERPPSQSTDLIGGKLRLNYDAWDKWGGSVTSVYWDTDDEGYDGVAFGDVPFQKLVPGAINGFVEIDPNAFPADGLYYFYAQITPGPGGPGNESETELAFSTPRLDPRSRGRGLLMVDGVDTDRARIEGWSVACVDDSVFGAELWRVEGSVSGVQSTFATTGVPYTTDDGAITFTILSESLSQTGNGDQVSLRTVTENGITLNVLADLGADFRSAQFRQGEMVRILAGTGSTAPGFYTIRSVRSATELILDGAPGTSDGTGVTYQLWPFTNGRNGVPADRFRFLTTGLSPYSIPIEILNGAVVRRITPASDVTYLDDLENPFRTPPVEVRFDASGTLDEDGLTNPSLTYEWDFGDGTGGVGQIVDHTYTTSPRDLVPPQDAYVVALTVRNTGTGATVTTTVEVLTEQDSFADADGDLVRDIDDNCPATFNPDQADADGDGLGDACDDDSDNDGVPDTADNCPLIDNPTQANSDGDAFGDACDLCPGVFSNDNTDTDGDGLGNPCDADDDNDGVPDASDNCPLTQNGTQVDNDADGQGDACDPDDDNDGVIDVVDNCPFTDNADQTDTDGDGIGDVCDADADNDNVPNAADNCPFTANNSQSDVDNDGLGDACDPDADNDGVPSATDNCPLVFNPAQLDNDLDGDGDLCDLDDDNDGVFDISDNCPFAPNPNQGRL